MTTTGIDLEGSVRLKDVGRKFRTTLSSLRARVRARLVVEGVAFLLLAFAVYFVVTWPVDRMFRLEVPVRTVLLVVFLGWVVYALSRRVFRPLVFELDDDELALAVERSDPAIGQKLISAVQFHRQLEQPAAATDSPALMGEVVGQAPALLETISVGRALKADRARRSWLTGLSALAFLGAVAGTYPGFGIWAERNLLLQPVDWPRATLLSVIGAENGAIVVPRGDDFTIEVDAGGVVPESLRIEYWFEDGAWSRESMTQNIGESRFTFTFPGLMDPLTFYAYGGDGETEEIAVRLVDRPVLASESIRLHYPDYMSREPQDVAADATELLVPRGTVLHLKGRASKRLARAELAVGEKQTAPASLADDGRGIEGRIRPEASGIFRVKMVDVDGLTEGQGRRLLLRVVPDKAPRLVAKVRGIGAWITQRAQIPLDLTATDDFGLQVIKLFWGVGDNAAIGSSEELAKTFQEAKPAGLADFEPGSLSFERIVRHDLLPLLHSADEPMHEKNPVRPGHFVSVRFKAWDNQAGNGAEGPSGASGGDGGGQWATTDSFTFKVVTDSELLRELRRRQSEQRVQLEKLLARERSDRAEFRELAAPDSPGQVGARIRNRLSHLARQQRALAKRVLEVGRRYAQILDEMVNNRVTEGVGGEGRVRALRAVIVEGLERLGTDAMPGLARGIALYARRGDASLRPVAESGYDDVVRSMERIIREMLRLESFTEILTKLKDLIRLEGKTAEETRKRYKTELEAVFGPGRESGDRRDGDKKNEKKNKDDKDE